jgi:hypothetical protein
MGVVNWHSPAKLLRRSFGALAKAEDLYGGQIESRLSTLERGRWGAQREGQLSLPGPPLGGREGMCPNGLRIY